MTTLDLYDGKTVDFDLDGELEQQKVQREKESVLITGIFGESRDIKTLEGIDLAHLKNAVSITPKFVDRSYAATASLVTPQLYNAARTNLYDWRFYQKGSIRPEVAIYLDCIAREEEMRRDFVSNIKRIEEGLPGKEASQ